jgi:hypothetical protein
MRCGVLQHVLVALVGVLIYCNLTSSYSISVPIHSMLREHAGTVFVARVVVELQVVFIHSCSWVSCMQPNRVFGRNCKGASV